ncbi:MAG: hypothetical protein IJ876_00380 [Elusimicrobiaceae bacterium]|nr:hypothetical protein [Elusimicrobiaceae bacterium]
MKKIIWLLVGLLATPSIWAAVGCDLNEPDRDVKRFFPTSSRYTTAYESIQKSGGEKLLAQVEHELGEAFSGLYEKIDVPYTVYTIYQKDNLLGYIHGVNQKGKYGAIQVFLVLTPQGKILDIYFQKLTSKQSKFFRSDKFRSPFTGLSYKDFAGYDISAKKLPDFPPLSALTAPPEDTTDFYSILRGIKKNLILMQHFVFGVTEENL